MHASALLPAGMSHPVKAKGFRVIRINGVTYRWRLRMGPKRQCRNITKREIWPQQAIITLLGVDEPWLTMPEGTRFRFVVTPATIRQLINEALQCGWNPNERVAPLKFGVITHATA